PAPGGSTQTPYFSFLMTTSPWGISGPPSGSGDTDGFGSGFGIGATRTDTEGEGDSGAEAEGDVDADPEGALLGGGDALVDAESVGVRLSADGIVFPPPAESAALS
ncbi:hypothetical protein, partial [Streptomyces olivaceus]|uniref:hypothetical protein n=1 Tax=Streptomyces olivaceus TaxID=47716 RepID=UPI004057B696